jgi:hypothetical protein
VEIHKTQGLAAVVNFLKDHQLQQALAVVVAAAHRMETVREDLAAMVALVSFTLSIRKIQLRDTFLVAA